MIWIHLLETVFGTPPKQRCRPRADDDGTGGPMSPEQLRAMLEQEAAELREADRLVSLAEAQLRARDWYPDEDDHFGQETHS